MTPQAGGAAVMKRPSAFNPHVHGARGLFSLMVFFFHIANSGLPTFAYPGAGAVHFFFMSFQYGVELFFGISGFVIIGALARARSIGAFAWDRFTRIYPVLWASIVVLLALGWLLHQPMPTVGALLLNLMVPPPWVTVRPIINPPSWSLTWEISFYALCAVGFAWRARRGAVAGVVAVGMTVVVLFPRTMLMLPGVLIGTNRLTAPWINRLARHPLPMLLAFLLAWHGLGSTHQHVIRLTPLAMPIRDWLPYIPGIVGVAILGTAALKGITDGAGVLGPMLAHPVFQWLGTISYSFYLWHPLAIHAGKVALEKARLGPLVGDGAQLAVALIAMPVALGIAWISQQLLEARLTRWLRLRAHGATEPVVTTAEAAGRPAMRNPSIFKRRRAVPPGEPR